jgi:hypothetical protein
MSETATAGAGSDYLQRRVTELVESNAKLNAALKSERKRQEAVRKALAVDSWDQVDGALAKLREGGKAAQELERLKAQALSPDDKDKRIADLEGAIKTRDFSDKFRAEAIAAGVDPKRVDKLLKVSDLKPPDGELKDGHFKDYLAKAKESDDWAFSQGTKDANAGGDDKAGASDLELPPARTAGEGRGQADNSSGLFTVRRSDAGKPAWMQANQSKLAEASSKGTLRWID